MKKLIQITCAFLLCLAPSLGYSAPVWHTSTIYQVYPLSEGSIILILTSDAPSCLAGTPDYYYIQVGQNGVTAEGLKNMYAAALLAAATGMAVAINFDDSTSYCYINRLAVTTD